MEVSFYNTVFSYATKKSKKLLSKKRLSKHITESFDYDSYSLETWQTENNKVGK